MSLSQRTVLLAQRIASMFKIEQQDLTPYLLGAATGRITLWRVGGWIGYLSYSIGGADLGAPTSSSPIALLPATARPIEPAGSGARVSSSGAGFAAASVQLSSGGELTVAGNRTGDTQVTGSLLYLLR